MLSAFAAFAYVDFKRLSVINLSCIYEIAVLFTPSLIARLMKNRKQ